MFFNGYKQYTNKSVNPALLWEYDLADFDFNAMRTAVVQKVVERGWPEDWYAILHMYGLKGGRQAIKDIPFNEMKCFKNKQSMPARWNS